MQTNKVFVKNTMEKDLLFICFQCLIAGALCGFKKDGGTIPLNKNLWQGMQISQIKNEKKYDD